MNAAFGVRLRDPAFVAPVERPEAVAEDRAEARPEIEADARALVVLGDAVAFLAAGAFFTDFFFATAVLGVADLAEAFRAPTADRDLAAVVFRLAVVLRVVAFLARFAVAGIILLLHESCLASFDALVIAPLRGGEWSIAWQSY
jgi:hypothetical protein